MWAIIKKEVKSYFYSPVGYVFIGAFLFVSSVFFYLFTWTMQSVEYSNLFFYTSELLTFTIAILTMSMFAGERKNGTETLLFTSSRSITSIVIRKILSSINRNINNGSIFNGILHNPLFLCRRNYKRNRNIVRTTSAFYYLQCHIYHLEDLYQALRTIK